MSFDKKQSEAMCTSDRSKYNPRETIETVGTISQSLIYTAYLTHRQLEISRVSFSAWVP